MGRKCILLVFFLVAFCGCWSVFSGDVADRLPNRLTSGIHAGSNGFGKQALMRSQCAGSLSLVAGNRNTLSNYLNQLFSRTPDLFLADEFSILRWFAGGNYSREVPPAKFLNDLLNYHIIVRAGPFC